MSSTAWTRLILSPATRDGNSVLGYPWVLDLTGVGLDSFLHPRVEPAQNRVRVWVSFFTRGCTETRKIPET
jgi:hypothetical protein